MKPINRAKRGKGDRPSRLMARFPATPKARKKMRGGASREAATA
nr:hypothetical protein [Chelativorans alearense]